MSSMKPIPILGTTDGDHVEMDMAHYERLGGRPSHPCSLFVSEAWPAMAGRFELRGERPQMQHGGDGGG